MNMVETRDEVEDEDRLRADLYNYLGLMLARWGKRLRVWRGSRR